VFRVLKAVSKRAVSLSSAIALMVTGLVAAGASPATASGTPAVKSFSYSVRLETPGSPATIPSTVYKRIDFQAGFNYDDVTSLRGHVITVDTVDTGFTEANRPMTYAYFSFKDANNLDIAGGAQINRVFSGQQLDSFNSITIPSNAVKMDINWVAASNISDGNYGPVAAGTYSSTPKIFNRGTVVAPISPSEIAYTSGDVSTAGLYYEAQGSYINVEGIATGFNLPASGTINRTSATAVGCIDWSKVSETTEATVDFKVNGQTPSFPSVTTYDNPNPNLGLMQSGSTLNFSTGNLSTWRIAAKPIYVFASNGMFDSSTTTNGAPFDAYLDVVDANNLSILKSCVPPVPTGTGTLGAGSMQGQLQYTPTSFVPPTGSWSCNLYKKSDNTLVATGSGSGAYPCMITSSYAPGATPIPSGVPLYVKPVLSINILGQSLSAEGATASNEYTMTNSGGGGGGGGGGMNALYPLAGASLSGNLTVGSVLTATPSTWSLTAGGAAITPSSGTFRWYVCNQAQNTSTDMNHSGVNIPACFSSMSLTKVLEGGNSIGTSGTSYGNATLTLTPQLMTALNGKYLAVMVNATLNGTPPVYGNVLLPTCGAIGTATTCAVSAGGTPPVVRPPAKKTPKAATVASKLKIGKTITVGLHATKGTAAKGANADGLATVVSIATASKKICTATKVVKNKKITGYTIKGLKAGKCSVVVAIGTTLASTGKPAVPAFNALTKTTSVTVSK